MTINQNPEQIARDRIDEMLRLKLISRYFLGITLIKFLFTI